MTSADVAAIVFLAYYVTGLQMVLFHSTQPIVERPTYVRYGFGRKFIAGAFWPVVALLNAETAWHLVTFISAAVIMSAEYPLTGYLVASPFWRTQLLLLAAFTPVVNAPNAMLSAAIWMLIIRPLGVKMPPAVESRFGPRRAPTLSEEVQREIDDLQHEIDEDDLYRLGRKR